MHAEIYRCCMTILCEGACVMGVKMGWIQMKMGHPLARNGAALAPFRANGAHPSIQQYIQRFAGWLSQICDENSRMRGIFN